VTVRTAVAAGVTGASSKSMKLNNFLIPIPERFGGSLVEWYRKMKISGLW
jgi:hypothetical protein